MKISGTIHQLPFPAKMLIIFFLLALSFGFFSGFRYLKGATNLTPAGIEKNYNGNEKEQDPDEVIFKKSQDEILTVIHAHALSMSMIFFLLGIILLMTTMNETLKYFLLIEPFVSIVVTFGGIWLMWKEVIWFKYVVMVSGIFLSISYMTTVLIIAWQLFFYRPSGSGK